MEQASSKVKLVVEVSGYVEIEVEGATVAEATSKFIADIEHDGVAPIVAMLYDVADTSTFGLRVSERLSAKANKRKPAVLPVPVS